MSITIHLDDQLCMEARKLADDRGIPLTALIDGALREALARRKVSSRRSKFKLTTFGGRGL
jgi:hypothetical protein